VSNRRKAQNLELAGGLETDKPIFSPTKRRRRVELVSAKVKTTPEREGRMVRVTGFTVRRVKARRRKLKRGATEGLANPRAQGTHLRTEQSLEVER